MVHIRSALELAVALPRQFFFPEKKKRDDVIRSKLLFFEQGPAMPLKTHAGAPGSTKSERPTTTQARESFVRTDWRWCCVR